MREDTKLTLYLGRMLRETDTTITEPLTEQMKKLLKDLEAHYAQPDDCAESESTIDIP